MGFLFGKKGPGRAEHLEAGLLAGYALGLAVAEVGSGRPFAALVFCAPWDSPMVRTFSIAELDAWTSAHGEKHPHRAQCVTRVEDGTPTFVVTAFSAGLKVEVAVAYRVAPFALALDGARLQAVTDEPMADAVKEGFEAGLTKNESAAPFLSDGGDAVDPALVAEVVQVAEAGERELIQKAALLPHGNFQFSQDSGRFTLFGREGKVT